MLAAVALGTNMLTLEEGHDVWRLLRMHKKALLLLTEVQSIPCAALYTASHCGACMNDQAKKLLDNAPMHETCTGTRNAVEDGGSRRRACK
jgi:hypothetical protein